MKITTAKLPTLIFLFILLGFDFCYATTKVTIYCDDNYPPYSYLEEGETKGIYVEIFKKAFSQMDNYSVKIRAVPYKRGLYYLKNGTGFALFPPYYRPTERPYIWPYSEPVLLEKVIVICREKVAKNLPGLRWPEDYFGLKIGNNAGFKLGGERFREAVKNRKIIIDECRGNRENILKLGLNRIDCYINDRLSILWELNQLKEKGSYIENKHAKLIETSVISSEYGYLGFSRNDKKFKFKKDFIKEINKIIIGMRKSGEIKRIVSDYIKK